MSRVHIVQKVVPSVGIARLGSWLKSRQRTNASTVVHIDGCHLDLEVDPSLLVGLLAHVKDRRGYLGKTEPYWSILTARQFKDDAIGLRKEVFYNTGAADVALFKAAADRCGVSLPWYGTCLELGCGVGRITPWLRGTFDNVVGADISSTHLTLAEQHIRNGRYKGIDLLLLERLDSLQQLQPYDCFFSFIALQHNPPPLICWWLRGMLEKLKPGGVGFFQLPVFARDYNFVAVDYLQNPPPRGEIEVHCLPLETVYSLLREAGCDLLDVREHDCLGPYPNWVSKTFLVRKG